MQARIELLEATQHAHLDGSQMSEAELDAQPGKVEAWRYQHLIQAREVVAGQPAPVVKESLTAAPAGSLVERVADAIGTADDEGLTNMTWNYHARAALREVAAWLREREGRHTHSSVVIAGDLEQEATQ
jgi:hypothetical protein